MKALKRSPCFIRLMVWLLGCLCLAMFFRCAPVPASTIGKNDRAVAFESVPVAAKNYQRLLTRSAHAHWGLDAPVATMAAQVHQESRWQPDAKSPVGAQGLAQFMPATSDWFATLYPASLGDNQPYNPGWALRALVLYDRWLHQRVSAADNCQRWAMTLSAYNGGLGWVYRDKRLASAKGADSLVWFDSIENYSRRADWARRENRDYVRNILTRWEPIYAASSWGAAVCL